jgi:hypothetical protein
MTMSGGFSAGVDDALDARSSVILETCTSGSGIAAETWQAMDPRLGRNEAGSLPGVATRCALIGAACEPGSGQRGGQGEDPEDGGERGQRGDDPVRCEHAVLGDSKRHEQVRGGRQPAQRGHPRRGQPGPAYGARLLRATMASLATVARQVGYSPSSPSAAYSP